MCIAYLVDFHLWDHESGTQVWRASNRLPGHHDLVRILAAGPIRAAASRITSAAKRTWQFASDRVERMGGAAPEDIRAFGSTADRDGEVAADGCTRIVEHPHPDGVVTSGAETVRRDVVVVVVGAGDRGTVTDVAI